MTRTPLRCSLGSVWRVLMSRSLGIASLQCVGGQTRRTPDVAPAMVGPMDLPAMRSFPAGTLLRSRSWHSSMVALDAHPFRRVFIIWLG